MRLHRSGVMMPAAMGSKLYVCSERSIEIFVAVIVRLDPTSSSFAARVTLRGQPPWDTFAVRMAKAIVMARCPLTPAQLGTCSRDLNIGGNGHSRDSLPTDTSAAGLLRS